MLIDDDLDELLMIRKPHLRLLPAVISAKASAADLEPCLVTTVSAFLTLLRKFPTNMTL